MASSRVSVSLWLLLKGSAGGERPRVQLLERVDLEGVGLFARGDGLDDGLRAGHGRHTRDVELERGAADGPLVVVRGAAEGRVDDERDLAEPYLVGDVRPPLV